MLYIYAILMYILTREAFNLKRCFMIKHNNIKYLAVASGIAAADSGCQDGPYEIIRFVNETNRTTVIDVDIVQQACNLNEKLDLVYAVNYLLSHLAYNSIKNSDFPIVLGGDHSCAIGTWSGIASAYEEEIGLIWIDAHLDAHTFETSISKNIHGMPVAVLLGQGHHRLINLFRAIPKIKPENLCIIGARCYEEGEQKTLEDLGVKIIYMNEVSDLGFANAFNLAREHIKRNTSIYGISIDLDAIDPMQAPGVGTPVEQGIDNRELLESIREALHEDNIIGFELAEYNPHHDINNATLNIIFELIGTFDNKIEYGGKNERYI